MGEVLSLLQLQYYYDFGLLVISSEQLAPQMTTKWRRHRGRRRRRQREREREREAFVEKKKKENSSSICPTTTMTTSTNHPPFITRNSSRRRVEHRRRQLASAAVATGRKQASVHLRKLHRRQVRFAAHLRPKLVD